MLIKHILPALVSDLYIYTILYEKYTVHLKNKSYYIMMNLNNFYLTLSCHLKNDKALHGT